MNELSDTLYIGNKTVKDTFFDLLCHEIHQAYGLNKDYITKMYKDNIEHVKDNYPECYNRALLKLESLTNKAKKPNTYIPSKLYTDIDEAKEAFEKFSYAIKAINKAEVSVIKNEPKVKDNVNHPSHYTQGGIECIDALESATAGLEGIEALCTANAIKYLWRWKFKNGIEDLDKAIWYINHLKEHLDKHK